MTKFNAAVIGSNYGDEAKGRTVDYLARQLKNNINSVIVRFSGSNNAGHTVYKDENTSHVFSLLGAGSYYCKNTYLSKHVVVDIQALKNELDKFNHNNYKFEKDYRTVYIDPRCRVCLPYDVMKNRIKEILRDNKHGSTGNGLNETIDRHEYIPLNAGFIEQRSKAIIAMIQEDFKIFVKNNLSNSNTHLFTEDDLKFIEFLSDASSAITIFNILKNALYQNKFLRVEKLNLSKYNCIFEGSQGLLLDEYSENYPHVTRSRTGVHNIIDICREFNIELNEIYYVSRPYLSRHGNDLNFNKKNHEAVLDKFNIVDKTNVHNRWQGTMAYDFLNLNSLSTRILDDYKSYSKHFPKTSLNIAFSCMDQFKDKSDMENFIVNSHKELMDFFKQHYIDVSLLSFDKPWNE